MSMRFIDQRHFDGDPVPGDCVRACIATILGLELDDVPHFVQLYDCEWAAEMQDWCEARGVVAEWRSGWHPTKEPAMLSGPSPRTGRHAVVMQHGEIIHDPHPSRLGLVTSRNGLQPGTPFYFITWIFRK